MFLQAGQGGDEAVAREAPEVRMAVNVVAVRGQRTGLRVEMPLAANLIFTADRDRRTD